MDGNDIVIVGGGLAGAVTAEEYRKAGGEEKITVISHDPDRPVHRPPLSKEYLRGDEVREKVFVHPPEFYREHDITVHLETRIERLDLASKRVIASDGRAIDFGKLVLATGARPRELNVDGARLQGVFYLRSLASSEKLREAYAEAQRAVIIGAGFIGMEVAATLTQRGISCTVVEMGPRMWPSLVPEETAGFIQRYFEAKGVDFRFGRTVSALDGQERVQSVALDNGEVLPADLVVIGVGVALNTELAEAAGLPVDRGVVVDEYLRTEHPDVYAVGDVARFPDPIGGQIHLEHWDNALNQGRVLGKTLAGQPTAFDHVAYFFSDLFDLSLNMIGYPLGWDQTLIRGDIREGKFTTVYLRDGTVRAALMINDDEHFDDWTRVVRERRSYSDRLFEAQPSVAS